MNNILIKLYLFIYKKLFGSVSLARKLGVKIGEDCRLIGKVDFGSEPYLIEIGKHVSITTSSFVTHDGGVWVMRKENPKLDVIAPIKIGNNVFIGTSCIILPGTIIGNNVVIGAGSIVKGNIESNSVYAGVPAKRIKPLKDYMNQCISIGINTKGMRNKEAFIKDEFLSDRGE